MVPLRRQILIASFKIADILVVGLNLLLTSLLYSLHLKTISIDQFLSLQVKLIDMVMAIVLVALWHIVFVISGLYRSRRLSNLKREIIDVVKATALGTLVVFVTAGLLWVDHIHLYIPAEFFLL